MKIEIGTSVLMNQRILNHKHYYFTARIVIKIVHTTIHIILIPLLSFVGFLFCLFFDDAFELEYFSCSSAH